MENKEKMPKKYVIGKRYRVSWSTNRNVTFILKDIGGTQCTLITKGGNIFTANLIDLRE
jgi:hypothetical protein